MDLSFLRPLYELPGPWASVYLDASHDTHDAAKAIALRWEHLRDQLFDQGTDESTLEVLASEVTAPDGEPGPHGLAVFATAGMVVMSEPLPAPPVSDIARFSTLPHAMPLAVAHGESVAWLRILADRTGADLTEVTAGEVVRSWQIQGENQYPIHKAKPGGWSAPRYQRAVEENWDRNAADVAGAVAKLTERVMPEVVVLAGDVRARQLLRDRLPVRLADRVVETETGSRAPGSAEEPLDEVTAEAVRHRTEERISATLDRLREGGGRYGVTGFTDVVEALRQARVETMVLVDDPSSTAKLWIGPEATQLARDADGLRAEGVTEPVAERADAALLRALVATDAELLVVEPDLARLSDGIGAVLRYSTEPEPIAE